MDFENKDAAATIAALDTQIDTTQPRASPFKLPEPNRNNDHVYAYLRGCGISGKIIRHCIENGLLYESAHNHRCVFVGKNSDGRPKFACEHCIWGYWKGDVAGSDKRFSFHLPAKTPGSTTLAVFESAIDTLAHCELFPDWDGYRLSLSGTDALALTSFLERNPQIKTVALCLGNNEPEQQAAKRTAEELGSKQISDLKIIIEPPLDGKDYADMLAIRQRQNIQPTRQHRREI